MRVRACVNFKEDWRLYFFYINELFFTRTFVFFLCVYSNERLKRLVAEYPKEKKIDQHTRLKREDTTD